MAPGHPARRFAMAFASLNPAATRKGSAPIGKTEGTRTEAVSKLGYRSSPGSKL